jgi:hypothetical protein
MLSEEWLNPKYRETLDDAFRDYQAGSLAGRNPPRCSRPKTGYEKIDKALVKNLIIHIMDSHERVGRM